MSLHLRPPCDDVPQSRGSAAPAYARHTGRWVLAATVLGSSMAFIDGTVVNVSLPAIQQDLDATLGSLQWIVEAYALFLAALIVVGGALGDRWGHRRLFLVGVLGFAGTSVLCGLAAGAAQLIAARALQGVAGALLVPSSLAVLSAAFPTERRGAAIGIWSAFTALTTALGPVLGGWLVETYSWRLIFFINLPAAALVLAITLARVPPAPGAGVRGRLDLPGVALITGGLGALVYGLIAAGEQSLPPAGVAVLLGLGLAALVGFILHEASTAAPMMPVSLFRSRDFSGANLLTLLLYAALSGALFLLPFNLIQVHGYSPTAAGAAFLPLIAILAVLSRFAGGLQDRFGARLPLVLGPVCAAGGYLLMALLGDDGNYWRGTFPGMVILGVGMAVSVAPLTTTVMNAAGPSHTGVASGVNNAVSRTGGLLAIALVGLVAWAVFDGALTQQLTARELSPAVEEALLGERSKLAAARLPEAFPAEVRLAAREAVVEAFGQAYRVVMLAAAGLAALGALAAGLMIRGRRAGTV